MEMTEAPRGGLDAIPLLTGAKPFMGHMAEFERDRFGFLRRIASEVDHVARLRFSTRDVVLANSPETIHEVLVEKARCFEKSPMIRIALHPLVGEGLFTSGGALWRRQRKLMAPIFHHDRIDELAPAMVECARRACAAWQDGQTLDAASETTRIAMSVAGKTLFGIDTFDESDAIGHALTVALQWANDATLRLSIALQVELRMFLLGITSGREALRAPLEGLLARLEEPVMWPVARDRELRRAIELLDERVQRMIEERRAASEPRSDLLDHLLHARDEDDGGVMTDKQVRDEILTLFIAGHETTANGLAWAIYSLARQPELYARVRTVVDGLGGRRPGLADLDRLELLGRVFKESLRVYPPVFAIPRVSVAQTSIGGYAIPEQTIVMVSPWTVQHRGDLWPEPDRFDPDRFLPQRLEQQPDDAWIPFSDGPRVCIGAHFAQLEAPLVLATILQHADFALTNDAEITPDDSPTLRPRGGVPIRVARRS